MIRASRYDSAPLLGLPVASARGAELLGTDGRRYIDCCAGHGGVVLGHGHPVVAAALTRQIEQYSAPGNVAHAAQMRAAAALQRHLPDSLVPLLFCTGGAEAIELAVRTARAFTGRTGVLGFRGHFHGKTHGAMYLLESYPDPYGTRPAGYARHLDDPGPDQSPVCTREAFEAQLHGLPADALAAVICEPVVGYTGPYAPPAWFMPCLRAFCDACGILLIADEVFCGLYRCGPAFVSTAGDVAPDLLIAGKALGNGLPVSAVAARPHLGEAMATAAPGSTFSDHPLLCAAAVAVLEVMESMPQLPGLSAALERIFFDTAADNAEWMRGYGVVASGRGALLGLRWPTEAEIDSADIARNLLGAGIAVANAPDRLRLSPPLVIDPGLWQQATTGIFGVLRGALA